MGLPTNDQATFGEKTAIKFTGAWESSSELQRLGYLIGKNRNSLLKKFKEHSTHSSYDGQPKYVTFAQAKGAMSDLQISDDNLHKLLSVGLVEQKFSKAKEAPGFGYGYYEEKPEKLNPYEGLYDFHKILQVYKERYDLKVGVF
jgi:hypothetical protein